MQNVLTLGTDGQHRVELIFSAISAAFLCDLSGEKLLTAECAKNTQSSQRKSKLSPYSAEMNKNAASRAYSFFCSAFFFL